MLKKILIRSSKVISLSILLVMCLSWLVLAQPLQIWIRSVYYSPFNEWLKEKTLEWSKANKVDVKVSVMSDYLLDQKLVSAIETKEVPDVVMNAEMGVTLLMEAGMAVPLDDVVDLLDRNDFYPLALKAYALPDEFGRERVFAIPMFFEFGYWYVREDLVKRAGLEIPDPASWEWIVKMAKTVNNPPYVYGLGIPISPSYDALNVLSFLLYHYKGGFITDISPHGADIFNTEPTWKLFADLKTLYKDKIIPPDAVSWTDFDNNLAYMEGRIASTWNPGTIMGAMGPDHRLTPVTKMIAVPPISLGGECVFICKSTPKREALAKKLIYYIFSDKETYRKKSCDEAGYYGIPIFKSQGDIVTHQYLSGEIPFLGNDPMDPIRKGEAFFGTNVPYPYGKATSIFEAAGSSFAITSLMGPLFIKDKDPKDVAKNIALYLNAMLAQNQ